MEKPKKKANILAIILGVILVAVTTFGVLLYTGVVKSPMVKEKDCTETTTKKDDTKKTDTKTDTTKSADERYKEYITNLASSIKEKSTFEEGTFEEGAGLKGIINDTYTNIIVANSSDPSWIYTVSITKDLDLLVTGNGYTDYKIASNVVSYYRIFYGQAGYSNIYFITTDGVLHTFNLESFIYGGKEPHVEDLDKKNIIEVRQGSTTASYPIFVDIDGNLTDNNR